jgi:hypothetical protein
VVYDGAIVDIFQSNNLSSDRDKRNLTITKVNENKDETRFVTQDNKITSGSDRYSITDERVD